MVSLFNRFLGEKTKDEDPQWLMPLLGESSLLSSSEYDFVATLCSSIMHKAQSASQRSEARAREIVQIAETMKNNFQLVVEKLQMNSSSRQLFQEKYPEWRMFRDMNVRHLRKIANSLDDDRQNCQASKAIGSLISLIGGGISLAAGNGDNQTSQMIGSALMGIGTLTSAGTSAVEEILLKESVDKAKKIMEVDQEYMGYLVEWLDEASDLQKAMNNIQSIVCTDFQAIAERLQDISKENLSSRQEERAILNVVKSLDLPVELRKEVSDIIGILTTVTMLFDRYRPVFNLALKSYNVMSKLRLSADLFRAAYIGANSVSTLTNRGGQLTNDQRRRVVKGMAMDAFNILTVSLQDPNSVEGREIRRIAVELEKEANQLENVYGAITSLDISNVY